MVNRSILYKFYKHLFSIIKTSDSFICSTITVTLAPSSHQIYNYYSLRLTTYLVTLSCRPHKTWCDNMATKFRHWVWVYSFMYNTCDIVTLKILWLIFTIQKITYMLVISGSWINLSLFYITKVIQYTLRARLRQLHDYDNEQWLSSEAVQNSAAYGIGKLREFNWLWFK